MGKPFKKNNVKSLYYILSLIFLKYKTDLNGEICWKEQMYFPIQSTSRLNSTKKKYIPHMYKLYVYVTWLKNKKWACI